MSRDSFYRIPSHTVAVGRQDSLGVRGGWAQTKDRDSDALATGEALYAPLHDLAVNQAPKHSANVRFT